MPGAGGGDHRAIALHEAFTPTRPQRSFRKLAGRKEELRRILEAISENRSHVVLYGERGRGKTSLVNLIASSARSSGYAVARHSCDAGSELDGIMRGLARDMPRSLLAVPAVEETGLEGCEAALPRGTIQPRDIAHLPTRLSAANVLLVIDEFDRVSDATTRTRLADAIKQISDRAASLSFLIVGVSDSLDALLGRHPSIQRSVVGVPLPLLSDHECLDILELGANEAGLSYPPQVRGKIIELARGVPYIVQLLALYAGARALARNADAVSGDDLRGAMQQAVAEMDPRVRTLYDELTQGELDRGLTALLLRLARTPHDGFARFLVQDVDGELRLADEPIHPVRWARMIDSGAVRPCRGAGLGLHTFAEPLLLHYVLLRAEIAGAHSRQNLHEGTTDLALRSHSAVLAEHGRDRLQQDRDVVPE
jgi:Cdc6-like AAA superfamily ATPase